jgi:integration host factor subunit beta
MSDKLTKAELIDALYSSLSPKSGTTRKEIHELIDGLFSEIKGSILRGKTAELRGFGTFEVKLRKGRSKARNPKTGEILSVKDHGVAIFRPGRELKQEAWGMDSSLIAHSYQDKD